MRKPPKNSLLVNVCIVPPAAVSGSLAEISKSLESPGTMFTLGGDKFPHMTLYMARFAEGAVASVLSTAGRIVGEFRSFMLEHVGYFLTAGRYLEVSYRKSDKLIWLHEKLVAGVGEHRINPGRPFREGYFALYTVQQQKYAKSTGYDLAYGLYRPHVTLTRYKPRMVPRVFPSFASVALSFALNTVCVYRADDNGAACEKLGGFSVPK